uniref:Uncharacterized protein n=1 Tax=Romanomermis culicivorax TaxID=13658 RepID=A0A915KJY9_ROMCU
MTDFHQNLQNWQIFGASLQPITVLYTKLLSSSLEKWTETAFYSNLPFKIVREMSNKFRAAKKHSLYARKAQQITSAEARCAEF